MILRWDDENHLHPSALRFVFSLQIPYVPGDYRTCKEYGAYGGGYQNATYGGGYANNTNYGNQQYQPAYQQQQVNYQATQNYQSQGYPSPKYGVEQSAYQQAPKYSAQYGWY